MKLYYYEYKSTVLLSWDDTSYETYYGFLIESALGITQFYIEDEANVFESMEEFKQHVSRRQPKEFSIVELK
jgi:hypothetical protein